jgi:hypothetical protein
MALAPDGPRDGEDRAARPLSVELPFPIATASEQGAFSYKDRDEAPVGIFGLPSDWLAPEDRFERT